MKSSYRSIARTALASSLIAGGVFASIVPAQSWSRDYFRNYMATCEDNGFCITRFGATFPVKNGESYSWLAVVRQPGTKTQWNMGFSFSVPAADATQKPPVPIDANSDIAISVDGQEFTLAANKDYWINDFTIMPRFETASQLLQAMRGANWMTVTAKLENGEVSSGRYSLMGLSKSLNWIVKEQGRPSGGWSVGDSLTWNALVNLDENGEPLAPYPGEDG
ncbi:MAG: hypothetical protein AAFO68_08335 [Pseudomonadota bacterium]